MPETAPEVAPEVAKTTSNTPVSDVDPGGTRPKPADSKPTTRQQVQSGDQNVNPPRGTDR